MAVLLPSCIMHGKCIKMIYINLYSLNALSYNKSTCWMYAYALASNVVSENHSGSNYMRLLLNPR